MGKTLGDTERTSQVGVGTDSVWLAEERKIFIWGAYKVNVSLGTSMMCFHLENVLNC